MGKLFVVDTNTQCHVNMVMYLDHLLETKQMAIIK